MTSNGGTMPVPQNQSAFSCSHCGLMFESASSLQVHMHYQHSDITSSWGTSPSSTTPTAEGPETNNNHQPLGKHHIKAMSPHQNTIAPADSSDNNPPTPQPNEPGTPQSFHSGAHSPYSSSQNPPSAAPASNEQREMAASYPSYYDQYYHGMEYGHAQAAHHHLLNNGQHHQQEYKTVPSSRYHQQTSPFNNTSQNPQTTSSNSVQISNNGLSPRVVSSTSPSTQTSTSPSSQLMHIPPGQPTPSPSPKQCDKCGVVCETDGQLIEHSQVAHAGVIDNGSNRIKGENGEQQQNYPPFPPASHHYHHHVVKDEPSSDILDLDSQKMVYPPHPDGALPSMHSLHPLQSMQRHPMMWSHDAHFIPPHPGYHQPIKPEYPPTPPIKNEYMHSSHMKSTGEYSPILPPTPASMKQEYNHIKADYNGTTGMAQSGSLPPASSIGSKNFATDISDGGNQLTSSPSDFPSTTTPHQENGGQYQRSFEPPTSSLPSSKGANWKSNEARRPKTYNCTACNKWFTSSGHLKRHYNTTLHKNAVKSSGQPDPATLPISAHHHPNRDPNYMGKRRSHHNRNQQANQQQQQQQQQQQAATVAAQAASQNQLQQQNVVSESSTRSPDYQPQFSLPSFGSAALQQGFGQYGSNNLHNSPGNGQAGPSVHVASQPRGLHQILMSNSNLSIQTDHQALLQHQQEQLLHQPHHQLDPTSTTTTINSTPPPCTTMQLQPTSNINSSTAPQYPLHITTNTHFYPMHMGQGQNSPNTIGNLRHSSPSEPFMEVQLSPEMQSNEHQLYYAALPSIHPHPGLHMTSYDQMTSRYMGGAAYAADMVPPFSPDIPEQYHQMSGSTIATSPYDHDMVPQGASMMSPAPSSPSVSSSVHMQASLSAVSATSSKQSKTSPTSSVSDFRCETCDKSFNKSCYLTQHNKTFHCGEKPYKCHRCGKRFPCDASHEEHVAKHGGDKPFKCEICPKAFNHKTDLRRHMCLHSGSKPFTCSQCGKGFIRKDHMVKHTDTHKKKLNPGGKKPKANSKKRSTSTTMTALPDSNDSHAYNAMGAEEAINLN